MNACIFDLDGTLTDTLSTIAFHMNNALKKFNFPPIELEKFKYFWHQIVQIRLLKCFLAQRY